LESRRIHFSGGKGIDGRETLSALPKELRGSSGEQGAKVASGVKFRRVLYAKGFFIGGYWA